MQSLKKFLTHFDLFSFPITLTIDKKTKSSTILGKVMTLFIFAFLFYTFMKSDMILKQNPAVLSQDLKKLPRSPLTFSKNNFTLAVGVADINNIFLVDPQMFRFIFTQYRLNNQNGSQKITEYEMKLCTPEDFKERPDEFNRLGLNGTYCVSDDILELRGYWDEDIIYYYTIDFSLCSNSSSNNTCKRMEDIEKLLKVRFIDVYFTNNNFDFANYENPIKSEMKMYYYALDLKLRKEISYFIKNSKISTDDGFIFGNHNTLSSYQHGSIEVDLFSSDNTANNDIKQTYIFYLSDLENITTRRYQTFQQLLAQMGGIVHFLMVFGYFLAKIENRYNLLKLFSNEMFIFQRINKKPTKKNSLPMKMKPNLLNSQRQPNLQKETILISTDTEKIDKFVLESKKPNHLEQKIIDDDNPEPESIRDQKEALNKNQNIASPPTIYRISNKKKRFSALRGIFRNKTVENSNKSENPELVNNLSEYQKLKGKESYFTLNFLKYLKLVFLKGKKWKLDLKDKLFIKGEKQIDNQLDLVNILKILQDVEKLKRVLLSQEQLYLFNLLSKPMIRLPKKHDNIPKDSRLKFTLCDNKKIDKDIAIKAYLTSKEKNSEIDKRILELLDEDIRICIGN